MPPPEDAPQKPPDLAVWLRALRWKQWVKNVLVFLPLLFSHQWTQPGLIGRAVLGNFHHVDLLHIAVPLLFAFAAIRGVVYLLRHVFVQGGVLAWQAISSSSQRHFWIWARQPPRA